MEEQSHACETKPDAEPAPELEEGTDEVKPGELVRVVHKRKREDSDDGPKPEGWEEFLGKIQVSRQDGGTPDAKKYKPAPSFALAADRLEKARLSLLELIKINPDIEVAIHKICEGFGTLKGEGLVRVIFDNLGSMGAFLVSLKKYDILTNGIVAAALKEGIALERMEPHKPLIALFVEALAEMKYEMDVLEKIN